MLQVRHQAEHVARFVAHARDIADRAVAILRIAKHDLIRRLQAAVKLLVGKPAALPVLDGDAELLTHLTPPREDGVQPLHPQADVPADELEVLFAAGHRAGAPPPRRIWKPLQIPKTAPPWDANRRAASITGATRAIAPTPEVVAVGGNPRQDDRAYIPRKLGVSVPDGLSVRSERAEPRRHRGRRSNRERRRRSVAECSRGVELDLEALDQQVREQLLAHALELRPRLFGARGLQFESTGRPTRAPPTAKPSDCKGGPHGLSLRIEDACLGPDIARSPSSEDHCRSAR